MTGEFTTALGRGVRLTATEAEGHPVMDVWRMVAADTRPVADVVCLKDEPKTSVFRVALHGSPQSFIVKRSGFLDDWEREIYEEICPAAGVAAPRVYGCIHPSDDESVWLVMEDLGEEQLSLDRAEDRVLAAHWLAKLHVWDGLATLKARLPERGPAHSLAMLQTARLKIAQLDQANDGSTVLATLLRQLDELERLWPSLTDQAASAPDVLVHGDLHVKNSRIRSGADGRELIIIDWERSICGAGVPCIDLAQRALDSLTPDLATYQSRVSTRWPHMTLSLVSRLADIGSTCRLAAALEWDADMARAPWAARALSPYVPMLDTVLNRLDS